MIFAIATNGNYLFAVDLNHINYFIILICAKKNGLPTSNPGEHDGLETDAGLNFGSESSMPTTSLLASCLSHAS